MKRTFWWLAIAAVALGIAVLAYRGPGRAIVRGHVGDVAAAMLVFAIVSALWTTRAAIRAIVTLAIATAIELGQAVWHADSLAGELLVGNTWDPWDLVAYVAGVGVALVWEAIAARRCAHER